MLLVSTALLLAAAGVQANERATGEADRLTPAPDMAPNTAAQHIVGGEQAWEGSLALTRRDGRLSLHYRGPNEGEIGKHYPMRFAVSGRKLVVSIAERSIPNDPAGKTLPACGRNRGKVELPAKLSGRYSLEVRKGSRRARYVLEVSDDVRTSPRETPPEELRFAAALWRGTPLDAVRVRCDPRPPCSEARCRELFSSEPVSQLRPLDDGTYLQLIGDERLRYVHADASQIAVLRASAEAMSAGGCAVSIATGRELE